MVREWPRRRDNDANSGVRDLLREQVRLGRPDECYLDLITKRLLDFRLESDDRRDGVRALDVDGQRDSSL